MKNQVTLSGVPLINSPPAFYPTYRTLTGVLIELLRAL